MAALFFAGVKMPGEGENECAAGLKLAAPGLKAEEGVEPGSVLFDIEGVEGAGVDGFVDAAEGGCQPETEDVVEDMRLAGVI